MLKSLCFPFVLPHAHAPLRIVICTFSRMMAAAGSHDLGKITRCQARATGRNLAKSRSVERRFRAPQFCETPSRL